MMRSILTLAAFAGLTVGARHFLTYRASLTAPRKRPDRKPAKRARRSHARRAA